MLRFLLGLICRIMGHKWETYIYETGCSRTDYASNIEQAGICLRCGLDTHSNKPKRGRRAKLNGIIDEYRGENCNEIIRGKRSKFYEKLIDGKWERIDIE